MSNTNTNTTIYPGMISADVELFDYDNRFMFMSNGQVQHFDQLPLKIFQSITDLLNQEPDEVKAHAIAKYIENDTCNSPLEQFAWCRFGGLDFTPDIKVTNIEKETAVVMQDGEYWACPYRGSCASEGILCKLPKVNGHRLDKIEVQILRLLHTTATNEAIADQLDLPLGTYHLIKKKLYVKMGNCLTRHEVTRVADSLNIK